MALKMSAASLAEGNYRQTGNCQLPTVTLLEVPGLCHDSLLNFWERQIWLFGKDAIWQSLSQIVFATFRVQ